MRELYKRFERFYNRSMIPSLIFLGYLCWTSLELNTNDYQFFSYFISLLLFGSAELYYFGIDRADLERRGAGLYVDIIDKKMSEQILELIANDVKAFVLTIGGIYFLHIALTGRLIPFLNEGLIPVGEINVFTYIMIILTTSSLPAYFKLKKESKDSIEIILLNFDRLETLVHQTAKVRDKNSYLFDEIINLQLEEIQIGRNEGWFQKRASEIKSLKWEALKIFFSIAVGLI